MTTVTARVPGKVNLQLSVGERRSDGFHDVVTVYHAVSLYDDVVARPAEGLAVTVDGEGAADVPVDERNLAVVAARRLADHVGVEPAVSLHLRKGIPVAGGMAGGSADAAATLLALDHLWELALPREALFDLAAEIGSDVPFALLGHTAIGMGRGEQLTPALAPGSFEWVFALADSGLATASVYQELDRLRGPHSPAQPTVDDRLMSALRAGEASALGRAMRNDLQSAAVSLRPQLAMVLDVGEEYGALASMVCGSGPSCVFLARDEEHALDLAVSLSAAGVCRTVRRATGPVAGARLVAA